MLHRPGLESLRPVSSVAREGEHSAVVWKRLNASPFPASRSAFGVSRWMRPTRGDLTGELSGAQRNDGRLARPVATCLSVLC